MPPDDEVMELALPELTTEERRDALKKAAFARKRRSEVSTALKARELSLPEALKLAETDEALAKMRVNSLLKSLPRVGPHRAEKIMEEVGIARSRRLQGLGSVQKERLLNYFEK